MNQLNTIVQQNIVPKISLNMEHRMILSNNQREYLLEERQKIIENSIQQIQLNFFLIGKALAEIKKFKLYKNDFCSSWRSYIHSKIKPQLHQSTISDYIGIVRMQIENKDFIHEEDIVKLGYKKSKLIKAKMNLIEKETDLHLRKNFREKIREFYLKSINKEFRDLPYQTYEKALLCHLKMKNKSSSIQSNYVIEKENKYFKVKWDKKQNKIIINSKENNNSNLENLYNHILNLNSQK